jgi:hypothetical protein
MALPNSDTSARTRTAAAVDWDSWVASIERKRKQFARFPLPRQWLVSLTLASFHLDDIEVTQAEVFAATARGTRRRAFRSRQAQRVRNHLAIQQSIEGNLRRSSTLSVDDAIRWYTAISSGLCTAPVDGASLGRLERTLSWSAP